MKKNRNLILSFLSFFLGVLFILWIIEKIDSKIGTEKKERREGEMSSFFAQIKKSNEIGREDEPEEEEKIEETMENADMFSQADFHKRLEDLRSQDREMVHEEIKEMILKMLLKN